MSINPNNPSIEDVRKIYEEMEDRGMIDDSSKEILVTNLHEGVALACIGGMAEKLGTEDPLVLVLVVDASGSMGSHESEVIRGLKFARDQLIDAQNQFGVEIIIAVVVFNTQARILLPFSLVDQVTDVQLEGYATGGYTALNDATYTALAALTAQGFLLFKEKVRGGRRFVVVLTDGGENSSTLKDEGQIAKLMGDLRKRKVNTFAFIGYGSDMYYRQQARDMGFLDHNVRVMGDFIDAIELVTSSMQAQSQKASVGRNMGGQASVASGDPTVDNFFV